MPVGVLFRVSCALAAFLVPLLLYLDTLAPTVLTYDSGMLQTKAYTLGIGHPTGYPTFILLGKLFTYLPFGDVAYRVNLSSAVYAALASLFVCLAARRLLSGGRHAPNSALAAAASALAAVSFAVGPSLWSQAVVTEVYTLNALLVAATLHALLVWRETGSKKRLYLASFLAGLAMTAHMTSGLLLPTTLVFVRLARPGTLKSGAARVRMAAAFLAGLSPYLYLPLRAAMDPVMNYGDASTFLGFFDLISGGPYKGQMLAFGPSELPGRLFMYGDLLAGQFSPLLLAAAVVGVWAFLRADRAALALLGVFGLGSLAYALEYDIHDIAVYFVPSYLVVALLLAVGLHSLTTGAGALLERFSPRARYATPLILVPAILALALVVPETHRAVDQSENLVTRRLVEVVVEETEPGATVYGGRALSALYYVQLVEGRRPDLRLASAYSARTIAEDLDPFVGKIGKREGRKEEGKGEKDDMGADGAYLIMQEEQPPRAEDVTYYLEPWATDYEEDLKGYGYGLETIEENLYRVSPSAR